MCVRGVCGGGWLVGGGGRLLLLVRLLFLQKHGLLSAFVVYAGLKLRAPETPEALIVSLWSLNPRSLT